MTSAPTTETREALRAIAEAIRGHDRLLLATHENPDGDALGSILAAYLAFRQLGKDVVMFLAGAVPLPKEYGFMELDDLVRDLPGDATERVLVALDCANERRLGPDPSFVERAPLVLDIDHHHDNTRFGDLNLVVGDASSTGEILADLFAELGVELTPEIAEALYIAVVTDTGRFQYTNTSPKALRLAADLVEAGADVHRVFQGVYENVAFAKLKLLARALDRAQVLEGGRLIVSALLKDDFEEACAEEPFSEGIIDHLRAVEGAELVALIREPPTVNGPTRRVSLRTTAEDLDASAIARKSSGGGHRQAAGFSSELPVDEIAEFIRREFVAQAGGSDGAAGRDRVSGRAGGLVLVDKPVGPSSFAVVRTQGRRHGLKAGHAGTLDPAASGLLLVLLGPCTRLVRYLVGLDKRYVTRIRLGVRTATGDAEGEPVEETEVPRDLEEALEGLRGTVELRVPAASAVKIAGERAYRLHRRGVEVDMPVRTSEVHGLRVAGLELPELELELHVGSGTYVRAIADALGGHCRSLRRTAVGPFRVEDADDERVLEPRAALPHLPELDLDEAAVVRVRSGRSVEAAGEGPARLVHAGQLVAVARLGGGVARPETVLPS